MSSMNHRDTGRTYWRSLDELADTPEFRTFMHREFPAGASELMEEDRRSFLKVMGASLAFAGIGLTGCRRWPEQHVLPYGERPEGTAPGVADEFATMMELGGFALGQVVTSYNGRPTKIEGNTEHSGSLGGTTSFGQATVLDLYDPDRSRQPKQLRDATRVKQTWSAWDKFAATHFDALRANGGEGFWILSEATRSPSIEAQQVELRSQFPKATWVTYEPLANANEAAGLEAAFGTAVRPVYDLTRADLIVAFDSDFLGQHPDSISLSSGWAHGRKPDHGTMSRMLVVEPSLSSTGALADNRWAMSSSSITVLVARVAAIILKDDSIAAPFADCGIDTPQASIIAEQMTSFRGAGAVLAGPAQPAWVHRLVATMNDELGGAGTTVSYIRESADAMRTASIEDLAAAMQAGSVETLVMLGGNPVYNAPADLDFATGLKSVQTSVHLADQDNETSEHCTWHLSRAHQLECWGDGRSVDGTYSVQQPLILPLFDSRSPLELLAQINASDTTAGFDHVRRTFNSLTGSSGMADTFDPKWRATLHAGVLEKSAASLEAPKTRRKVPKTRRKLTPWKMYIRRMRLSGERHNLAACRCYDTVCYSFRTGI